MLTTGHGQCQCFKNIFIILYASLKTVSPFDSSTSQIHNARTGHPDSFHRQQKQFSIAPYSIESGRVARLHREPVARVRDKFTNICDLVNRLHKFQPYRVKCKNNVCALNLFCEVLFVLTVAFNLDL